MTEKTKTPKIVNCEWSIVTDTREQHPWLFQNLITPNLNHEFLVSSSRAKLDQGDYAVLGMESELVVERKSLEDLYGTLSNGRKRFTRELERISDEHRMGAVVIEADWSAIADPHGHRSTWHTGMNPLSVIASIYSYTIRYPTIQWLPMPTRSAAEWAAFYLMRFAVKNYRKKWQAGFVAGPEKG